MVHLEDICTLDKFVLQIIITDNTMYILLAVVCNVFSLFTRVGSLVGFLGIPKTSQLSILIKIGSKSSINSFIFRYFQKQETACLKLTFKDNGI